jgi:hypothetical protein
LPVKDLFEIESFSFIKLPKPTKMQVKTILKILENVAKRDAFFQQSKIQPNFEVFDQKK